MKLVFEYHWSVEYVSSGTNTIPFEYDSVEDFQYMVLEKIAEHKKKCVAEYGKDGEEWYRNGYIEILGQDMNVDNLENSIENNVYELNDWFEKKKL